MMNQNNRNNDTMEEEDLEFLNFDQLAEDEVRNIKNLLKHPCSAVQLPDDIYYGNEEELEEEEEEQEQHPHPHQQQLQHESDDEVYEQEDEVMDPKHVLADGAVLEYGAPAAVPMLSPYGAPIPQGPLYPIATTVGGNFIAAGSHIQQVVFVQKMVNGEAGNQNNPVLDSLPTVVSSNPYQPIGVYHYQHPSHHPHHTPQYVMSPHMSYINPYMQPAVTVCEPTIVATGPSTSCTVAAPNFIGPHCSIPNPVPIQIAPRHPLAEMVPPAPCPSVPVCMGEEAHLESVVVEVPPNNIVKVSRQSSVIEIPPTDVLAKSNTSEYVVESKLEEAILESTQGEISFLCPDEVELARCAVEAASCVPEEAVEEVVSDGVESEKADSKPCVSMESPTLVQNGDVETCSFTPSESEVVKDELPKSSEIPKKDIVAVEPPIEKPNPGKSWASLFKKNGSSAVVVTSPVQSSGGPSVAPSENVRLEGALAEVKTAERRPRVETKPRANGNLSKDNLRIEETVQENGSHKVNNEAYFTLGRILSDVVLDHRSVNYVPRGLSNSGNWCYINSILQALLACYPLYNLLLKLPKVQSGKNSKSMTPIMDCMVQFVNEFQRLPQHKVPTVPSAGVLKRDENSTSKLTFGVPFEPSYMYQMLSQLKLNAFEGRQEDAEEFLSCLLNGLHEEIVKAISCVQRKGVNNGFGSTPLNGNVENNEADNDSADEELWKVIEPRSKFSVTRSTDFSNTPLSDIFCGRMRSAVHASSTSSATLQPFFTLPLDIQSENVRTVKDALHNFVMKESLQDYHCAKTKQEVTASRQITLEELPPVLILHLKRFVFCKDGGCMKNSKKVDFSVDLDLHKDLISPAVRAKISSRQRSYKLVAVVYHCGSYAAKGHYVTDVYLQGTNMWFRADDHRTTQIPESKVLKHPPNLVPYLLFYRRLDTVQLSSSSSN